MSTLLAAGETTLLLIRVPHAFASKITYIYDAAGTKLQQKVTQTQVINLMEVVVTTTTDYIGGFHYEEDTLQFFAHEEGRVVRDVSGNLRYQYNMTDHLGNVRLTYEDTDSSGTVEVATEVMQANDPYPFGMNMAGLGYGVTPPANSYLYNGKELQDELGLNWYDYGARMYSPEIGRWNGVDALADSFLLWSPYNYTLGNPIKFIDPDGNYVTDGWYTDWNQKSIVFDPNVNSQEDLDYGQWYIGDTHTKKTKNGTAYYQNDGSIFVTNETMAYNLMWDDATTYNREDMGIIFSDGILILPSYKNPYNKALLNEYDYDLTVENGKATFISPIEKFNKRSFLGTIHTHNPMGNWGFSAADVSTFTRSSPNKPFFIIEDDGDGPNEGKTVRGGHGTKDGWILWPWDSHWTRENLLNGDLKLIPRIKNFKP